MIRTAFVITAVFLVLWIAGPEPLRAQAHSRTDPPSSRQPSVNVRPQAQGEASKFTPIRTSERPSADRNSRSSKKDARSRSAWTTVGWLLLVVTLILIGGRLLKKHPSLAKRGLPPAALEVLGRQVVDQRQSILIVRLGSRLLVLGANAGGMRTLAEITDPVEVDYLAGLCRTPETDATVAQTFRALFHRHVPEDATPTEDAASSIYPPEGRADSLAQSSEEPDLTPSAWEQSHA